MATAAILDFWNHEILLHNGVQKIETHQHAKFRQISCEDAIGKGRRLWRNVSCANYKVFLHPKHFHFNLGLQHNVCNAARHMSCPWKSRLTLRWIRCVFTQMVRYIIYKLMYLNLEKAYSLNKNTYRYFECTRLFLLQKIQNNMSILGLP